MIDILRFLKMHAAGIKNNRKGWRTNRKIVVFESDDWGSIRMPSKEAYDYCLSKGYQVNKNIYSKYDSLASRDDLLMLFNLLQEFKDSVGRHPVITANCLVTNPDFDKIRESDFTQYHYELLTKTFEQYPNHSKNWEIWQTANREGLFHPQSHGREHLNVSRFMNDLQSRNPDARFAFDLNMPGIFAKNNVELGNEYVVALEHFNEKDKFDKIEIISEGLNLFKKLFLYCSESFIACNYVWTPELESRLVDMGVKFIQGSKTQLIAKGNYSGFDRKSHYMGKKHENGMIYLTRNAHFEPSANQNKDWVDSCLNQINSAFLWKRPAVISSHRINFVGYIDPRNRDKNIVQFKNLLCQIITKWPMVEFMTTTELGSLISTKVK
ncbi:MAG: hypothetical protein PHU27_11940 [Salinivirgaceae bacterium]|nr:hypothetical protein [Salinivirgaceae bacterium]MDD4747752.1 hypothetical protein [Salinivirgaceae bacterium]MDY0281410.1 hypothetical protein [Salinivirgaceae bacterium]